MEKTIKEQTLSDLTQNEWSKILDKYAGYAPTAYRCMQAGMEFIGDWDATYTDHPAWVQGYEDYTKDDLAELLEILIKVNCEWWLTVHGGGDVIDNLSLHALLGDLHTWQDSPCYLPAYLGRDVDGYLTWSSRADYTGCPVETLRDYLARQINLYNMICTLHCACNYHNYN